MTLDGWATVVGTLTLVFTVVLTALGRFATWWYHRLFPAKLAEFDKIECAPMFRGHLKPSFDLIQVWFNNKERAQLAKDVSAYVEVFDVDNAPLTDAHCVWATGTEPSEIGKWSSEETTVDILPNNIPVKLNVAYRYTGKPDGELYTKAGASHRIPQGGPYRVRITLAGTEFTRVHKFTVENSSKFFVMKKA